MSIQTRLIQWGPAAVSLLVWFAVAFSVLSWALRLVYAPTPSLAADSSASATNETANAETPTASALARSLGVENTVVQAPSTASRLKLLGVVADTDGQGGALVSIDGQAAKLYRVGSPLIDGLVVQSVHKREVHLGGQLSGAPQMTLVLPKP